MKPGTFLRVGPNWQGEIPKGFDEVFRAESDFIGSLTRTCIDVADDIPKVREIQQGYQFTPPSAYTASKPPAPVPVIDFPDWHESFAHTPAFIGYVNFLLNHVNPHAEDAEALERFGARRTYSARGSGPARCQRWSSNPGQAKPTEVEP